MDLNEFRTRKELIDKSLNLVGWDINNKSQILVEVDTKQSDFKINQYKFVSETLKNDLESKYADYLLLDDKGSPLAIIEAKRTSKDPFLTASTQAEEYAKDVKAQTGKDIFIFLSNGYEVWFWNWHTQMSDEEFKKLPEYPEAVKQRNHFIENKKKILGD
jgi:type I restriction enzyme, R subunit